MRPTRLARQLVHAAGKLHATRTTIYTAAATTRSTTTTRVRSSRAATAPRCTLDWNVAGALDLTSISAYKDYHFQAVNDEGTPFDVYRNAGGFWNDYKQWSQELRVNGSSANSATTRPVSIT